MDFGVGFISTNIMLPILDFFYGIVHSYGFGIIALTLVVRLALFPLSAGQIRNMRKMRITQPLMKERQEEMAKLMQEFGNPLAGCLPLVVQMPILLALFATLRGSPFSDINYSVDLQVFPKEQVERVEAMPFTSKPQNIYVTDAEHYPVSVLVPSGNRLEVGGKTKIEFQTTNGKSLEQLAAAYQEENLTPSYKVLKGEERVQVDGAGTIVALSLIHI